MSSVPILLSSSSAVYPRVLWNNIFADGTLTVSSEDADYPKENLLNVRPWKRWAGTGSTPWTIQVLFASAVDITAWAMYGHNLGQISGTMYMETTIDGGSNWDSFGQVKTPSGDEVLYSYDDGVSVNGVRWTITGTAAPEIGTLYVGEELVFNRGVRPGFRAPILSQTQENRIMENLDGEPLGVSIEKTVADVEYRMEHVEFTWALANFLPFKVRGQERPFFTWWNPIKDPNGATFHNASRFPAAEFPRNDFVTLSFTGRGVV